MSPDRRVLDENVVAAWTEATGDRNLLHTNAEYAAQTPFGEPIVPGHLLAALVVDEVERVLGRRGLFSARLAIRFVAPVPVGGQFELDWNNAGGGGPLSGRCGGREVLTVDLEPRVPGGAA